MTFTIADMHIPVGGLGLPWTLEAALRLLLAALLGAIIGIEREHHGRSAGLRTHLLVALGAGLAMVVSVHFANVYGRAVGTAISLDPARVAYGVMGGIGFLGAGAILRYGVGVRGLTTAASLWCTAAVGLAGGFGMFAEASFATLIVLFALIALGKVEQFIPTRQTRTVVVTALPGGEDIISELTRRIKHHGGRIANIEYSYSSRDERETVTLHVSLPLPTRKDHPRLVNILRDMPNVDSINIT